MQPDYDIERVGRGRRDEDHISPCDDIISLAPAVIILKTQMKVVIALASGIFALMGYQTAIQVPQLRDYTNGRLADTNGRVTLMEGKITALEKTDSALSVNLADMEATHFAMKEMLARFGKAIVKNTAAREHPKKVMFGDWVSGGSK